MIKNLFVNKNSAKKKHINKTAITTIVTLSFCFNAFAQEAKGTDWTEEEWKKDKGGYGWVFPHIDKNADGKVTAAEYEAFQEFKRQHPNWEIELNPNGMRRDLHGSGSLTTWTKTRTDNSTGLSTRPGKPTRRNIRTGTSPCGIVSTKAV